jgi:hypothetical protein
LQSQFNLPPQQAAGAASNLARQYQELEQQAQLAAQQWRTLTARPQGDVQTTADIAAAKVKLQSLVEQAFGARQRLQREELLEMQRRIYSLASTIEDREKIKEQIIERRVQELLNPALQWPGPAASAPNATNPLNVPRNAATTSPVGQSAPAKGSPLSGGIAQFQGNVVYVSVGAGDDLKPGQVLHVFRGDEYVAELEVRGMQNDLAVARVKSKLSDLRPDDRIFKDKPGQPETGPNLPAAGSSRQAGRPLSDVVREFNAENANKSINRDQPLLTDDEVVAAIRWTTLDRKSLLASNDEIKTLLEIADSRKLPPQAELRMRVDLVPAGSAQVQRLSIRLFLPSPRGKPYEHLLREVYIGFQVTATNRAPRPVPDDPDAMPLEAAIKAFNQRHLNDPVGKDQPLLTLPEVAAAIRAWGAMRDEAPVTDGEFEAFQAIAQTGKLPAKAEFEVLTGFQPNDELQFTAWSVRIRMPRGKEGGSYAYTIRERWLRVKKLKEREIAWGPVAKNGLQVGLWIDPPSPVLTKGQQVVPHFYFRNASGKDATISLPRLMTHGYYKALQATDDTGEKIQTEQDEGPGGPVGWIEMPFAAGAEHEVTGLPIAVGQVKRGPGVETVICAVPGQQCRLRFVLSNYLDRKSDEVLQTGELRFAAAEE